MSLIRGKGFWRSVFYSRITLLLLICLCFLLAASVYERYTIERQMADRRIEAEQELQTLKERKLELQEKVEYLTAEEGIEAEIRKNFDVAREGEQVIIIVDEEQSAAVSSSEIDTDEKEGHKKSFWRTLFSW